MDDEERIATTRHLAADFVEAARVGGADCAIPSCPEWTMRQLAEHLALEYAGWYYSNLTLAPGTPDPLSAAMGAMPPAPEGFDELLDYIVRNASRFADHAREVDLDREVWVFDSVGLARFWLRQTIMEVGVHAWDAAMAGGRPSPLSEQISLEAVDQICAMQYHRGHWWGEPWTPPSTPFCLIATDAEISWFMYEEGGRAHYESGGAEKASARAAAPAESLYLWLAGRQTPSEVAVIGDPAIAQAWRPDWS